MPPSVQTDDEQDALLPSREMAIRLPVFEGPLDLLLFLIRKNELDIYDIPIEQVTHQYMAILREMEDLNLEVAGEFFVMASTLMYIKSRMLLPANDQAAQPEDEAEEADPRWELVEQLLEYKRFKDASEQIRQLIEAQQDYLPRFYQRPEEDIDPRPLKSSDRIELWNVFNMVLRRLSEKIVQGEIRDESVTVADRMEYVLNKLETTPEFLFSELFEHEEKITVPLIVASLLAILELARLKKLFVEQEEVFGDIRCQIRPEEEELPPLPDEDEDESDGAAATGTPDGADHETDSPAALDEAADTLDDEYELDDEDEEDDFPDDEDDGFAELEDELSDDDQDARDDKKPHSD